MAKGYVWPVVHGNGCGGINSDRIKRDHEKEYNTPPNIKFADEFKLCIMLRDWDGAFTVMFEAASAGVITEEYRDETIAKCIPCFKDYQ